MKRGRAGGLPAGNGVRVASIYRSGPEGIPDERKRSHHAQGGKISPTSREADPPWGRRRKSPGCRVQAGRLATVSGEHRTWRRCRLITPNAGMTLFPATPGAFWVWGRGPDRILDVATGSRRREIGPGKFRKTGWREGPYFSHASEGEEER